MINLRDAPIGIESQHNQKMTREKWSDPSERELHGEFNFGKYNNVIWILHFNINGQSQGINFGSFLAYEASCVDCCVAE